MTVTRTQNVTQDSWYANDGTNMGNGAGDRFGVGYSGAWVSPAWQTRFAIKVPRGSLFDGIPAASSITAFDIKLRAVNSCFGIGAAVRFFLERATTAMGENSQGGSCTVSTNGTTGDKRWPGPTRDVTNRGGYSGAPASGDWLTVNMLALGQWWYAHPEVTELVLVGVAADAALSAYDESTAARQCMFYGRTTASVPYAQLVYNDEAPPDQPTELYPPDASTVASTLGTQAAVSARYTQAAGLAATHYRFQWYPSTATDAVPGTPTIDTGSVAAATASGALRAYTFTGLPARTAGKWRVQFGRNGVWSAWSLLRAATTAYQPGVPTQLAVTPGTLTPTIGASLVSSDSGDYITAAQVLVYQDPVVGSTITKWDSGSVSVGGASNRLSLAYGGTALVYGTKYRLRVRLANRDGVWSEYTADFYFTPLAAVGPNVVIRQGGVSLPADTSTLVLSLTPTFRLSDPGAANIDQTRARYYDANDNLLLDTGWVANGSAATVDIVVPAGAGWAWGTEPKADFAIRLTGNADGGPFREKVTVHLDTVPGAPGPVAVVSTTDAVRRADGVWVVPTATPSIQYPYNDTDLTLGYTDARTRREIELRNMADAHVGASPYIITVGITDTWAVPAAILVAETTYKTRARYDDSANQRGSFSDYLFVKYSARPTVSAVTPANAATITDPTVPFAWTYAHSGGLPQGSYRVTAANPAGTVLYDSGWVASAAGTLTAPPVLPNATVITWTLQVATTDGLVSTLLSRTFTTNFTQPPALTGLVLTPDPATLTVTATWNASGLAAGEFLAYHVFARSGTGQWVLVKNIYTQGAGTVSYVYPMAGHNQDTIMRVTQDNGYMESPPLEASTQLTVEGVYRIGTDGAVTRLRYPQAGHSHPRATEDATYSPPGAQYQRVVKIGAWGIQGRLRLSVPPDDAAVVDQLVDDAAAGRVVGIKTGRGLAAYVRVTEATPADQPAGWFDLDLSYTEVGAEAAGVGPDD